MVVFKNSDEIENLSSNELQYLSKNDDLSKEVNLKGNIENFIGWTMVPTGIAGPLRINGKFANGLFQIPLATTEGALVASYNRGAKTITASGGATTLITKEGIQRSPSFKFKSLVEVEIFIHWITDQFHQFQYITSQHSNYAKLEGMNTSVEGNNTIITFEFTTGNAAGQNMITFCTEAICKVILNDTPVKVEKWFLESNYSGDKKATATVLSHVRGKRVSSEVIIKRSIISQILKSTPEKMVTYLNASTFATIQSGAIGSQGHYANGLTALFLATGQDVACISESSVGITRMEVTDEGDLYACVTLPSLAVGTIGGGTHLPTQNECLKIMNCVGENSALKLTEICGALALAGELSIAAAIAEGHFAKAHKTLGRKSK